MNWLLVALIGGSLITSVHETEEQCLGRKAVLEKTREITRLSCYKIPPDFRGYSTTITPCTNCIIGR